MGDSSWRRFAALSAQFIPILSIPPMLSIPNQLEGAYIGQDIALQCNTEAYPTSINYWTTERGEMIFSGDKYEAVSMDSGYNKFMMLKIRGVNRSDFVSYKCVAKNSLGETDGIIKLDEIPTPSTVATTTTTLSTFYKRKPFGSNKNWKSRGQSENQVMGEEWRDTKMGDEDYTLPSSGPPPEQSSGAQVVGPFTSMVLLACLVCAR